MHVMRADPALALLRASPREVEGSSSVLLGPRERATLEAGGGPSSVLTLAVLRVLPSTYVRSCPSELTVANFKVEVGVEDESEWRGVKSKIEKRARVQKSEL